MCSSPPYFHRLPQQRRRRLLKGRFWAFSILGIQGLSQCLRCWKHPVMFRPEERVSQMDRWWVGERMDGWMGSLMDDWVDTYIISYMHR